MNSKKLIGLIVLIFVFVIACAGTSEKSGTEQLSEQDLSFDPNEPWTGIWKAKLIYGGEINVVLKLKQNGNLVKSAKGCDYNIANGKVSGNRLKASYISTTHNKRQFLNLVMSDDLKSFEGENKLDPYVWKLKGVRQE
jgi:hypothetical protein